MTMTAEQFKTEVEEIKKNHPELNVRFVAFCVHSGYDFMSIQKFGPKLFAWISDRKRDYEEIYPYMTSPQHVGGCVILDQEHFSDFIVSGEWIK